MMRAVLSLALCLGALAIGFFTACRSAHSRARGAELDRRQRLYETFSRQNTLLESALVQREWQMFCELGGEGRTALPRPEVRQ